MGHCQSPPPCVLDESDPSGAFYRCEPGEDTGSWVLAFDAQSSHTSDRPGLILAGSPLILHFLSLSMPPDSEIQVLEWLQADSAARLLGSAQAGRPAPFSILAPEASDGLRISFVVPESAVGSRHELSISWEKGPALADIGYSVPLPPAGGTLSLRGGMRYPVYSSPSWVLEAPAGETGALILVSNLEMSIFDQLEVDATAGSQAASTTLMRGPMSSEALTPCYISGDALAITLSSRGEVVDGFAFDYWTGAAAAERLAAEIATGTQPCENIPEPITPIMPPLWPGYWPPHPNCTDIVPKYLSRIESAGFLVPSPENIIHLTGESGLKYLKAYNSDGENAYLVTLAVPAPAYIDPFFFNYLDSSTFLGGLIQVWSDCGDTSAQPPIQCDIRTYLRLDQESCEESIPYERFFVIYARWDGQRDPFGQERDDGFGLSWYEVSSGDGPADGVVFTDLYGHFGTCTWNTSLLTCDGVYQDSKDYIWRVILPPEYIIRANVVHFNTESTYDLAYAYDSRVADPAKVFSNFDEMSGDQRNKLPILLQTTRNTLTIRLKTDGSVDRSGIYVVYEGVYNRVVPSVPPPFGDASGCSPNGLTRAGAISSCSYTPDGSEALYDDDASKEWLIAPASGGPITITFEHFAVQPYAGDRLRIFNNETGQLLFSEPSYFPTRPYSNGFTTPAAITAQTGRLLVRWITDGTATPDFRETGFRLSWRAGEASTGAEGTITLNERPQYRDWLIAPSDRYVLTVGTGADVLLDPAIDTLRIYARSAPFGTPLYDSSTVSSVGIIPFYFTGADAIFVVFTSNLTQGDAPPAVAASLSLPWVPASSFVHFATHTDPGTLEASLIFGIAATSLPFEPIRVGWSLLSQTELTIMTIQRASLGLGDEIRVLDAWDDGSASLRLAVYSNSTLPAATLPRAPSRSRVEVVPKLDSSRTVALVNISYAFRPAAAAGLCQSLDQCPLADPSGSVTLRKESYPLLSTISWRVAPQAPASGALVVFNTLETSIVDELLVTSSAGGVESATAMRGPMSSEALTPCYVSGDSLTVAMTSRETGVDGFSFDYWTGDAATQRLAEVQAAEMQTCMHVAAPVSPIMPPRWPGYRPPNCTDVYAKFSARMRSRNPNLPIPPEDKVMHLYGASGQHSIIANATSPTGMAALITVVVPTGHLGMSFSFVSPGPTRTFTEGQYWVWGDCGDDAAWGGHYVGRTLTPSSPLADSETTLNIAGHFVVIYARWTGAAPGGVRNDGFTFSWTETEPASTEDGSDGMDDGSVIAEERTYTNFTGRLGSCIFESGSGACQPTTTLQRESKYIWHVNVPRTHRLRFTVNFVNVDPSQEYVRIFAAATEDYDYQEWYHTGGLMETITVEVDAIATVVFNTGPESIDNGGVDISWEAVQQPLRTSYGCAPSLTSRVGYISECSYASGLVEDVYPTGASQSWEIAPQCGAPIRISFLQFSVQPYSGDRLRIFDAASGALLFSEPSFFPTRPFSSGFSLPNSLVVDSPRVLIRWETDAYETYQRAERGFRLKWVACPENWAPVTRYEGESGEATSSADSNAFTSLEDMYMQSGTGWSVLYQIASGPAAILFSIMNAQLRVGDASVGLRISDWAPGETPVVRGVVNSTWALPASFLFAKGVLVEFSPQYDYDLVQASFSVAFQWKSAASASYCDDLNCTISTASGARSMVDRYSPSAAIASYPLLSSATWHIIPSFTPVYLIMVVFDVSVFDEIQVHVTTSGVTTTTTMRGPLGSEALADCYFFGDSISLSMRSTDTYVHGFQFSFSTGTTAQDQLDTPAERRRLPCPNVPVMVTPIQAPQWPGHPPAACLDISSAFTSRLEALGLLAPSIPIRHFMEDSGAFAMNATDIDSASGEVAVLFTVAAKGGPVAFDFKFVESTDASPWTSGQLRTWTDCGEAPHESREHYFWADFAVDEETSISVSGSWAVIYVGFAGGGFVFDWNRLPSSSAYPDETYVVTGRAGTVGTCGFAERADSRECAMVPSGMQRLVQKIWHVMLPWNLRATSQIEFVRIPSSYDRVAVLDGDTATWWQSELVLYERVYSNHLTDPDLPKTVTALSNKMTFLVSPSPSGSLDSFIELNATFDGFLERGSLWWVLDSARTACVPLSTSREGVLTDCRPSYVAAERPYLGNQTQSWTIEPHCGGAVNISFEVFNVQPYSGDRLRIWEEAATSTIRFSEPSYFPFRPFSSGTVLPATITIASGRAIVRWETDGYDSPGWLERGFRLRWKGCFDDVQRAENGSIVMDARVAYKDWVLSPFVPYLFWLASDYSFEAEFDVFQLFRGDSPFGETIYDSRNGPPPRRWVSASVTPTFVSFFGEMDTGASTEASFRLLWAPLSATDPTVIQLDEAGSRSWSFTSDNLRDVSDLPFRLGWLHRTESRPVLLTIESAALLDELTGEFVELRFYDVLPDGTRLDRGAVKHGMELPHSILSTADLGVGVEPVGIQADSSLGFTSNFAVSYSWRPLVPGSSCPTPTLCDAPAASDSWFLEERTGYPLNSSVTIRIAPESTALTPGVVLVVNWLDISIFDVLEVAVTFAVTDLGNGDSVFPDSLPGIPVTMRGPMSHEALTPCYVHGDSMTITLSTSLAFENGVSLQYETGDAVRNRLDSLMYDQTPPCFSSPKPLSPLMPPKWPGYPPPRPTCATLLESYMARLSSLQLPLPSEENIFHLHGSSGEFEIRNADWSGPRTTTAFFTIATPDPNGKLRFGMSIYDHASSQLTAKAYAWSDCAENPHENTYLRSRTKGYDLSIEWFNPVQGGWDLGGPKETDATWLVVYVTWTLEEIFPHNERNDVFQLSWFQHPPVDPYATDHEAKRESLVYEGLVTPGDWTYGFGSCEISEYAEPQFCAGHYDPEWSKIWRILMPWNYIVDAEMRWIETEANFDFVTAYDSDTDDESRIIPAVSRLSGRALTGGPSIQLRTTGSALTVKLTSDRIITGPGIRGVYYSVKIAEDIMQSWLDSLARDVTDARGCAPELRARSGAVSDCSYRLDDGTKFIYPKNRNGDNGLSWLIAPLCGGPITITFELFSVQPFADDRLRIYNIETGALVFSEPSYFPQRPHSSGTSLPDTFTIDAPGLYVLWETDEFETPQRLERGFRFRWRANSGMDALTGLRGDVSLVERVSYRDWIILPEFQNIMAPAFVLEIVDMTINVENERVRIFAGENAFGTVLFDSNHQTKRIITVVDTYSVFVVFNCSDPAPDVPGWGGFSISWSPVSDYDPTTVFAGEASGSSTFVVDSESLATVVDLPFGVGWSIDPSPNATDTWPGPPATLMTIHRVVLESGYDSIVAPTSGETPADTVSVLIRIFEGDNLASKFNVTSATDLPVTFLVRSKIRAELFPLYDPTAVVTYSAFEVDFSWRPAGAAGLCDNSSDIEMRTVGWAPSCTLANPSGAIDVQGRELFPLVSSVRWDVFPALEEWAGIFLKVQVLDVSILDQLSIGFFSVTDMWIYATDYAGPLTSEGFAPCFLYRFGTNVAAMVALESKDVYKNGFRIEYWVGDEAMAHFIDASSTGMPECMPKPAITAPSLPPQWPNFEPPDPACMNLQENFAQRFSAFLQPAFLEHCPPHLTTCNVFTSDLHFELGDERCDRNEEAGSVRCAFLVAITAQGGPLDITIDLHTESSHNGYETSGQVYAASGCRVKGMDDLFHEQSWNWPSNSAGGQSGGGALTRRIAHMRSPWLWESNGTRTNVVMLYVLVNYRRLSEWFLHIDRDDVVVIRWRHLSNAEAMISSGRRQLHFRLEELEGSISTCRWTEAGCDRVCTDPDCRYAASASYRWHIVVPYGYYIVAEIKWLHLEPLFDELTIYDAITDEDSDTIIYGPQSGGSPVNISITLQSTRNALTVVLQTSYAYEETGIHIDYKTVQVASDDIEAFAEDPEFMQSAGCAPDLMNRRGVISDCSFALDKATDTIYWANQNREWIIAPSCGGPITISFEQFSIQPHSGDRLRIYDEDTGKLLFSEPSYYPFEGYSSGNVIPGDISIATTRARITWQTDDHESADASERGFRLRWVACETLRETYGSASLWERELRKDWLIRPGVGPNVIWFSHFSLDQTFDRLRIFDGEDTIAPVLFSWPPSTEINPGPRCRAALTERFYCPLIARTAIYILFEHDSAAGFFTQDMYVDNPVTVDDADFGFELSWIVYPDPSIAVMTDFSSPETLAGVLELAEPARLRKERLELTSIASITNATSIALVTNALPSRYGRASFEVLIGGGPQQTAGNIVGRLPSGASATALIEGGEGVALSLAPAVEVYENIEGNVDAGTVQGERGTNQGLALVVLTRLPTEFLHNKSAPVGYGYAIGLRFRGSWLAMVPDTDLRSVFRPITFTLIARRDEGSEANALITVEKNGEAIINDLLVYDFNSDPEVPWNIFLSARCSSGYDPLYGKFLVHADDHFVKQLAVAAVGKITDVIPSSGPRAGGNIVTIVGTGFAHGSGFDLFNVSLSGTEVAEIIFAGRVDLAGIVHNFAPDTILAIVRAAPENEWLVDVGHDYETDVYVESRIFGTTVLYGSYTYNEPITITSVYPNAAPATGSVPGDAVVLFIDLFEDMDVTSVWFGDVPAEILGQAEGEIVVIVPPAAAGPGPVAVEIDSTRCGRAVWDGFVYSDPPVIAGFAPLASPRGPASGLNLLTIIGQRLFSDDRSLHGVFLCGVAALSPTTEFRGDNATVTVAVPPHEPGRCNVTVCSSQYGCATVDDAYEYVDAGTIRSFSPSFGVAGTRVTISGSNLFDRERGRLDFTSIFFIERTSSTPAAGESADAQPDFELVVDLATVEILGPDAFSFRTPPGTHGVLDLVVNSRTVGRYRKNAAFQEVAVRSIAPDRGPIEGGTRVTVVGPLPSSAAIDVRVCNASMAVESRTLDPATFDTTIVAITANARNALCTISGSVADTAAKVDLFVDGTPVVYEPAAVFTLLGIGRVEPWLGSLHGGELVTITGASLAKCGACSSALECAAASQSLAYSDAAVYLAGVPAIVESCVSSNQLVVRTGDASEYGGTGLGSVEIESDFYGDYALPGGFFYFGIENVTCFRLSAAPVVPNPTDATAVDCEGHVDGGTLLLLHGTLPLDGVGLASAQVFVGESPATLEGWAFPEDPAFRPVSDSSRILGSKIRLLVRTGPSREAGFSPVRVVVTTSSYGAAQAYNTSTDFPIGFTYVTVEDSCSWKGVGGRDAGDGCDCGGGCYDPDCGDLDGAAASCPGVALFPSGECAFCPLRVPTAGEKETSIYVSPVEGNDRKNARGAYEAPVATLARGLEILVRLAVNGTRSVVVMPGRLAPHGEADDANIHVSFAVPSGLPSDAVLTIRGLSGSKYSLLDALSMGQILSINMAGFSGKLVISDMTFLNARPSASPLVHTIGAPHAGFSGGALSIYGSGAGAVELRRLRFQANIAHDWSRPSFSGSVGGGALFVSGVASLSVADCEFEGNAYVRMAGAVPGTTGWASGGGSVNVSHVGTVDFARVSFAGDRSDWGGGSLALSDVANLTLHSVAFERGRAPHGAGGCLHARSVGSVRATNVSFVNCSAMRGGAAFAESISRLSFEDSVWRNSSALERGGAAAFTQVGAAHFDQCEFANNALDDADEARKQQALLSVDSIGGGALSFESGSLTLLDSSAVHIDGCAFEDNEDRMGDDRSKRGGGAIRTRGIGTLSVSGSSFLRNRAQSGGAISGTLRSLLIEGSAFSENGWGSRAPGGRATDGGAISVEASVEVAIERSSFVANVGRTAGALQASFLQEETALGDAVSVRSRLPVLLHAVLFANHSVSESGGCVVPTLVEMNATAVRFEGNVAELRGGAVAATDARSLLAFTACAFVGNKAKDGAALSSQGTNAIVVSSSAFSRNEAGDVGGAIHKENGDLTVRSSSFDSNLASASGGAVYASDGAGALDFDDCTFTSNRAAESGGAAAFVFRSRPVFRGCRFRSNVAETNGGGVWCVKTAQCTLVDSWLLSGSARDGGAVYADQTAVVVLNGTSILGNFAERVGGGLYAGSKANVRMQRCNVSENQSLRGAGLYTEGESSTEASDLLLLGNVAASRGKEAAPDGTGGGACLAGTSSFRLLPESRVANNRADRGAGVSILDSARFEAGEAETAAAVPAPRGRRQLQAAVSVLIGSNTAVSSGGGVLQSGGVLRLLAGTELVDNQAGSRGGGLSYERGALTLAGTVISYNHATDGAGAYIRPGSCDSISIKGASIVGNEASGGGGAFFVDASDPMKCAPFAAMADGSSEYFTTLSGNKGRFGSTIAAVPKTLVVDGPLDPENPRNKTILASRAALLYRLTIVDSLGQVVRTATGAVVRAAATPVNGSAPAANVAGTSQTAAVEGAAEMRDLQIISQPGARVAVTFSATFSDGLVLSTTLVMTMRQCMRGEVSELNEGYCVACSYCQLCAPGFFSLEDKNFAGKSCIPCPQGADCSRGGADVRPASGYWQSPYEPGRFIQCVNRACRHDYAEAVLKQKGAASMLALNITQSEFVATAQPCFDGYGGNLCTVCAPNYGRRNDFDCGLCPDPSTARLIAAFVVFFLLLVATYMIRKHIKDVMVGIRENRSGIMLKIGVDYLQIVSLAKGFQIRWPNIVREAFDIQTGIAAPLDSFGFISFDCMFDLNSLSGFVRPFYARVLGFIFSIPLLCFAVPCVVFLPPVWYRAQAWWQRKPYSPATFVKMRKLSKNYYVVCVLVSLYLVYPQITQRMFKLFTCKDLGGGRAFLQSDMEVDCNTWMFKAWQFFLGVPASLVYGIGIPLAAFFILYRHRHRLDDPEVMHRYSFLYRGYERRCWYWEIVVIARKLTIALVVSVLDGRPQIQGLVGLGVLIVALTVNMKLEPWDSDLLDVLDLASSPSRPGPRRPGFSFSRPS
eukprot:tig00020572_g11566.t1